MQVDAPNEPIPGSGELSNVGKRVQCGSDMGIIPRPPRACQGARLSPVSSGFRRDRLAACCLRRIAATLRLLFVIRFRSAR